MRAEDAYREAIEEGLPVPFEVFAARLRACPDAVHMRDLLVAVACSHCPHEALPAFDARFQGDVARAARRGSVEVQELAQRLRIRLFVPDDEGRARIESYAGKGSLRSWVRVILARLVVDIQRERNAGVTFPAFLVSTAMGPELTVGREEIRAQTRRCIEAAFAELDDEARRLLRYRYARQLTIDHVARILGVHRATAARHLRRAEDRFRRAFRSSLALEVTDVEASMLGELDLSWSRLLATRE
ncbi:MAG: sigma-70 family RNA polymerase sigma factor [Myxococcota bacterium]